VLLREADRLMGGIWRIKFRRWCETSRYAKSVVSLLEGCDQSFQKGKESASARVGINVSRVGFTFSCTLSSVLETALPDSQPVYAPV